MIKMKYSYILKSFGLKCYMLDLFVLIQYTTRGSFSKRSVLMIFYVLLIREIMMTRHPCLVLIRDRIDQTLGMLVKVIGVI